MTTYEGDAEEAMDCIEDIMDSIDIEKASPTQMREALKSIAELFGGEEEDEEDDTEDGDEYGTEDEESDAAPEMPGTFFPGGGGPGGPSTPINRPPQFPPKPEKKRKSHGH